MKKITSTTIAIFLVLAASAQTNNGMRIDYKVLNTVSVMATFVLAVIFILAVLKRLLEYRLKNKIVDKGVSENIAASILRTTGPDDQQTTFKWFALLAGAGAGFTLVHYTQPLGYHSLAIMSFSIALSFLGYYFFIRRSGK